MTTGVQDGRQPWQPERERFDDARVLVRAPSRGEETSIDIHHSYTDWCKPRVFWAAGGYIFFSLM